MDSSLDRRKNFLSFDLGITEDCQPALETAYSNIFEKVKYFLNNKNTNKEISFKNAEYFDVNNHPLGFSRHIINKILDRI